MWNRRDYVMLAGAAVASFGLTVGMFWSRAAVAVDEAKVSTVEIKVPTLRVGSVAVTAVVAEGKAHRVVLTARNTSSEGATATFTAAALVQGPVSVMSRGIAMGQAAWTGEYTMDLKGGESKTIEVELPAAAYEVPAVPAGANAQTMRPGRSTLVLSAKGEGGQMVVALVLASPAVVSVEGTVQGVFDGVGSDRGSRGSTVVAKVTP